MITVANIHIDSQTGFLGNKMFMMANAIAYARRVGDEVVLPPWEFQDLFRYNPRTSTTLEVQYTYHEPHFHYAPIPLASGVNLQGYFQSEKYFLDAKDLIVEGLQPNHRLAQEIESRYGKVLERETVGIHIRRGDYLALSDHHPFVGLEYYAQALGLFPAGTQFLIVSNDIPWCRSIFNRGPFIFSDSPQEKAQGNRSAGFDLFLLSRCHHQIICNSSFSWWAAYLNRNPMKKVIAPSRWFGPAKTNAGVSARDVYHDSWTVLGDGGPSSSSNDALSRSSS